MRTSATLGKGLLGEQAARVADPQKPTRDQPRTRHVRFLTNPQRRSIIGSVGHAYEEETMKLDPRFGALLGQAVWLRRLALLLAAIFAFALLNALQPADTVTGPSSAEAHPVCGSKCWASRFYDTLRGCRRAGERALRADPYPNLDWEHYHCARLQTREGPVYRLLLWDLGQPG